MWIGATENVNDHLPQTEKRIALIWDATSMYIIKYSSKINEQNIVIYCVLKVSLNAYNNSMNYMSYSTKLQV